MVLSESMDLGSLVLSSCGVRSTAPATAMMNEMWSQTSTGSLFISKNRYDPYFHL